MEHRPSIRRRLLFGGALLTALTALSAEALARLRGGPASTAGAEDTGAPSLPRGQGARSLALEPLPEPTAEELELWSRPTTRVPLSPGCPDIEACSHYREVPLGARAAGLPVQPAVLGYDLHALTRAIQPAELPRETELSVAVRLVLAEVGPDRLLSSRWGLVEAMGVLRSVRNRLDPVVYNPDGHANLSPYPGCGPEGRFATCARPGEYQGLSSDAALRPGALWAEPLLVAAVDRAVLAYWLEGQAQLGDPTEGATRFEHRCGGRSYGQPVSRCSGRPREAVTGPIVFSRPDRLIGDRGYYSLVESSRVDFESWWGPRRSRGSRTREGLARLSASLGPPDDDGLSVALASALGHPAEAARAKGPR